jgi:hypothetical protein
MNTPKPKRGRPKSKARSYAEALEKVVGLPPSCESDRSKTDVAFRQMFFNAYHDASAEIQIRLMGFLPADILAGSAKLPRGYPTAATEIGRWIEGAPEAERAEAETVALQIVANARDTGASWRDIRTHFRKMRLGEREGNALSLFRHLARAYDEYVAKFPNTTQQTRIGGIMNLLEAVESPDE